MISTYACYLLAGFCGGWLAYEVYISYQRWATRRSINKYLDWKE